jgi:methyltransferase family protein
MTVDIRQNGAALGLFSAAHEMSYGEQAAVCGILSVLKPRLALELGTFRGGSLAPMAAYSQEVHTFDIASHVSEALPNVTYHIGDSQITLPQVLRGLAEAHRHVDFVLVDGDHSRAGVEADMSNLLHSPTLSTSVILLHDCANEGVREGARNAILRARGIAYADLSFVAPPARRRSPLRELWGGLGIVVVDRPGEFWAHERQVLPNVRWRTSGAHSLTWHALRPARSVRRDLIYRARPLYRRFLGSRGASIG